jgi:hypothetical protein
MLLLGARRPRVAWTALCLYRSGDVQSVFLLFTPAVQAAGWALRAHSRAGWRFQLMELTTARSKEWLDNRRGQRQGQ